MPIKIKREDGSITTYWNSWCIPAFLMIPEELLRRASREIYTLPRCRAALLGDRKVIEVIESDLFLATLSDIYAYMAWPHMGLEGKMEGYSGFDPRSATPLKTAVCWGNPRRPSLSPPAARTWSGS